MDSVLWTAPDDAPINILVVALADDDLVVRGSASAGLIRAGERAVRPVAERLAAGDVPARRAAASILGRITPPAVSAIASLVRALGDADGQVRHGAAEALAEIGPAALPAVRAALRDSRLEVRRGAVTAINAMTGGPQAAPDELVAMIADPDDECGSTAAEALCGTGPSGRAVLFAALDSANPAVRARTARALGQIDRGAPVIDKLRRLLQDDAAVVRRAAASALAAAGRGGAELVPDLVRAQDDPDPEVGGAATVALLEIIKARDPGHGRNRPVAR
jgi:vesicle coat complex subunit